MIILDTNVISEVMKVSRDPVVFTWLSIQPTETLFITATSLSELLTGIEILPAGRRRDALRNGISEIINIYFDTRVLPFDKDAAAANAFLIAKARKAGTSISMQDAQIASIAYVHGFTVATRDTSPFKSLGLKVINPWKRS